MCRTISSVLAALLISSALAPSALADAARKEITARVSYGDLDTSTVAGGVTLLKRIEGAARSVCGKRSDYSQLAPHAVSDCRHEAIASVVSRLRIEKLSLAYARAYPVPVQTVQR